MLIQRRISNRRATRAFRLLKVDSGSSQRVKELAKRTLGTLLQRYILQREREAYDESKSANDMARYSVYGYASGAVCEVRWHLLPRLHK